MNVNKLFFGVALAAVAVVLVWRGLDRNQPAAPGENEHSAFDYHRGHLPPKDSTGNMKVQPANANYPPRGLGLPPQSKPPSDSWLLDADTNWDRFRRLEVVLRGADIHMFEIGIRFGELHEAIAAGNFELANYEIERIAKSARIAQLKQPGWQESDGLDYLGRDQWQALHTAVLARDSAAARDAFLNVRRTCLACHAAKNLEFLNKETVFDHTAAFPENATAQAR